MIQTKQFYLKTLKDLRDEGDLAINKKLGQIEDPIQVEELLGLEIPLPRLYAVEYDDGSLGCFDYKGMLSQLFKLHERESGMRQRRVAQIKIDVVIISNCTIPELRRFEKLIDKL